MATIAHSIKSTTTNVTKFFDDKFKAFNAKLNPILTRNSVKKIMKVAKEAFYFFIAVSNGVLLGALSGMIGGPVVLLSGVILGGLAGAGVYIALRIFLLVRRHFGYPAYTHKEVHFNEPHEKWCTDEYKRIFHRVYKYSIAPKPWSQAWRNLHNFSSSHRAFSFLWNRHHHGLKQAKAQTCAAISLNNPTLRSLEILDDLHMHVKHLFYFQSLEFIRREFAKHKDTASEQQLAKLILNIPGSNGNLVLPLNKADLNNLTTFKASFNRVQLPPVIGGSTCVILKLYTKKKAYSIFVKFAPSDFCFYDPYGETTSGLYTKFKSESHFLETLFKHVKGYSCPLRLFAPRFKSAEVIWFY